MVYGGENELCRAAFRPNHKVNALRVPAQGVCEAISGKD